MEVIICQLKSKRVTRLSLLKLLNIHVVSCGVHMEYEEVKTDRKLLGSFMHKLTSLCMYMRACVCIWQCPLWLGERAAVGAVRDCRKSSCQQSGRTEIPQQCDRKAEAYLGVALCCKQKDCQALIGT